MPSSTQQVHEHFLLILLVFKVICYNMDWGMQFLQHFERVFLIIFSKKWNKTNFKNQNTLKPKFNQTKQQSCTWNFISLRSWCHQVIYSHKLVLYKNQNKENTLSNMTRDWRLSPKWMHRFIPLVLPILLLQAIYII